MMERSEDQIAAVARYGDTQQKQLASRVLESPLHFREWQSSHSQLLRKIVSPDTTRRQVQEVKRMALSMIHRKAPFEFVRDKRVSGVARHRFFREMFGPHDFAKLVVSEHRNYIAAGASYICVDRFCSASSMQEIRDYERRYTGYWRVQATRRLEDGLPGATEPPPELINELRVDITIRRQRLLNAAPRADELSMEELLRPNGDTVRMQYPPLHVGY
ncbi:MAG: hypothetical protein ABI645_01580 [Pseudomonadota bacterium]